MQSASSKLAILNETIGVCVLKKSVFLRKTYFDLFGNNEGGTDPMSGDVCRLFIVADARFCAFASYSSYFFTITVALWPPKPKAFERA